MLALVVPWSPDAAAECERGFCLSVPSSSQLAAIALLLLGVMLQLFVFYDRPARQRWLPLTTGAFAMVVCAWLLFIAA